MSLKSALTVNQEKPEVKWANCCERKNHFGFLLRVNGIWCLFNQNREGGTRAEFVIGRCRGCTDKLTDATPTTDWEWGVDRAIDKHLTEIVLELPKKNA